MEPIRKLGYESVPLPVDTNMELEEFYLTLRGLHGEMGYGYTPEGKPNAYCINDPWRAPENYLTFDQNGQVTADWNPNWDYQVQHCLIRYINSVSEGPRCALIPVVHPSVILEDGKAVHAVIEQCGCITCEINLVYDDDSDFYELINLGY